MRSSSAPAGPVRVVLLALLTASCAGGEAPTVMPEGALIVVHAAFPAEMTAQQFAQANFDRAEVKVFRGENLVIAQRSVALPAGFNQAVDMTVVLDGDTEDLDVSLEIWSANLLAFSGGASVTAIAGETVSTPEFAMFPEAPILAITTGQLTFTEAPGSGLLLPLSFDIRNSGVGTLTWSTTSSASWLTVNPTGGALEANTTQTVQLRASKAGLAPGTHTATVQIDGSGVVGAPVSLEVSLVVQAGRTLAIAGAGSGAGNVSSSPAGIACAISAGVAAGACSTTYGDGASVTLSAAANQGSDFAGWSGAGCSGAGACQVTMSQSHTVTATFGLQSPNNQNPIARFTASCSFLTCSFNGSASSDPDGTIVNYIWDFGDGGRGSGAQVTHAFASAGTYTVRLSVVDNGEGTGSVTRQVTTGAGGSVAGDVFVDLNGNDSFDGSDTPLSGATVSLSSGASTSTDATGSYTFASLSAGNYSVSVSGVGTQYTYGGTQPQPVPVTVTAGQSSVVDFPYDVSNPGPTAPSNVSGVAISEFDIDIYWTDNSSNEDAFEIELRQENTSTWVREASTAPNVETVSLGNLLHGTRYDARVRACSGGVCSAWVQSSLFVFTYLTPPDPSNVQILSATSTAVSLSWHDNSFTETSFVIEHGSLTTPWVAVGSVPTNTTTFTDTSNTIFGQPIFYRVAAVNSFGRSGESPPDSVTIPPAGQAPKISGISQQLISVNDSASCPLQTPAGSLFLVQFDYTDPDGDITLDQASLQNDWVFDSQQSGTFFQPPDPGLDFTGNGFSGTGFSYQCYVFVNSQIVDVTITLRDDAGNPSNQLFVNINRPSGANAPAAAAPATASGGTASGGQRPNPQ